jgi:hypothetical protein
VSCISVPFHNVSSPEAVFPRTFTLRRAGQIITITILDIVHHPVFYLKHISIGFSVPHRKHITSPLRAQQVNAIYKFVTMVY